MIPNNTTPAPAIKRSIMITLANEWEEEIRGI